MEFTDRDKPIECVQEMINEVEILTKSKKIKIYFKGQDWGEGEDGYRLIPSVGRKTSYLDKRKIEFDLASENNLLHRFHRYAYLSIGRPLGDWEVLFLARHHGLPVRLMDWTANPLIALFFAVQCERNEKNVGCGAVWAITKDESKGQKDIDLFSENGKTISNKNKELYYSNKDELNVPEGKNKIWDIDDLQKPLRLKGVRILYPFYNSPRMVAQHSFFTIQDDPWTGLNDKSYRTKDDSYIDVKEILRWKIPKEARYPILDQLERLNINNRTIFPDLDGLAKGLCASEYIRRIS